MKKMIFNGRLFLGILFIALLSACNKGNVGDITPYNDGVANSNVPKASVTAVSALPWTFRSTTPYIPGVNPPVFTVKSPAQGLQVFTFDVAHTDNVDAYLTRLSFQVFGNQSLGGGTLTNAKIVYLTPGRHGQVVKTVVGSNGGGPFVSGEIVLSIPVLVKPNVPVRIALLVDVTGKFFFSTQLQAVTISVGGVQKLVDPYMTEDIPVSGDQWTVQ